MKNVLVNASAFVLAAAATLGTFGGNAMVAKRQFATAERIASGPALAPPQHVLVVGRRWAKA